MKILIVGGAGYIGSHLLLHLKDKHSLVILDNLSIGYKEAVLFGKLVVGDLANVSFLKKLFSYYKFDLVIHCASFSNVAESIKFPEKYYQNNVINTLNLLNVMLEFNVKKLIFSSSAAIFGEPLYLPIDLHHPKNPINPYGYSKLCVENILLDFSKTYGLHFISLRYFNAAGADFLGRLGEMRKSEFHLIPMLLQAIKNKIAAIKIFGNNHSTFDGTCVRDYIHINDLCRAHVLVVSALAEGLKNHFYNLGSGIGYSVKEVVTTVEKITGAKISIINLPHRAGDPSQLICDSSAAIKELNWQPQYSLEDIIAHAWRWREQKIKTENAIV